MQHVKITLRALHPLKGLSEGDQKPLHEVTVAIDSDVEPHQLADAALDVFASTGAIDNLEAFDLEFWHNGKQLELNPNHDSYSMSCKGYVL